MTESKVLWEELLLRLEKQKTITTKIVSEALQEIQASFQAEEDAKAVIVEEAVEESGVPEGCPECLAMAEDLLAAQEQRDYFSDQVYEVHKKLAKVKKEAAAQRKQESSVALEAKLLRVQQELVLANSVITKQGFKNSGIMTSLRRRKK